MYLEAQLETERKILQACTKLQDTLGENYFFLFRPVYFCFFLLLVLKFLLCPTSGARCSQLEAGGPRKRKRE